MSDAIFVSSFSGMNRRLAPHLLPPQSAQFAENALSLTGALEGRRSDAYFAPHFGIPGARRLFRAEFNNAPYWLTFDTPNVDVVRAPLVNDSFERHYWAGEGVPPGFTTRDRMIAGDPPYLLGVERPAAAPVLTQQAAGVSAVTEDRAYVYTYVDELGHESAPSDPTFVYGIKTDATIRVAVTAQPASPDRPSPETVRIYRTVPGFSATAFFFVADIPAATPHHDDSASPAAVALNETLPSVAWFPPPADMAGMVVMPNGFLAGFRGKDVLFSEPYRPHAWPTEFTISVEDTIVGLAVFDTNLAILTDGTPYIASGVSPESMSLRKVGPANACVSRRSIVDVPGAVLYAGEDGLVSLTADGHSVITKPLITRDDWSSTFYPSQILAARDSERTYVGFFGPTSGFHIDLSEPERGVIFVRSDFQVYAFDTDVGGRRALMGDGENAYLFSPPDSDPLPYTWRSKKFHVPKPLNMGALQIDSVNPEASGTIRVRVIADGREVFNELVAPNNGVRLPSGYKAQSYEIELTGTLPVQQVALAETMKGLERV